MRMRVRTNHGRVYQSRDATLAAPPHRVCHRTVARDDVRAVAAGKVQAGEGLDETRDAAASRLRLDGDGEGGAVVFDEEDHGELLQARRVERFPEFTLARRAVADRDVRDFVRFEPVL